jgi:hypothetical protein
MLYETQLFRQKTVGCAPISNIYLIALENNRQQAWICSSVQPSVMIIDCQVWWPIYCLWWIRTLMWCAVVLPLLIAAW